MEKPLVLSEVKRAKRDEIRPGTPLWDAIVADLKTNISTHEIGRKHGIAQQSVQRINYEAGIRQADWQPGDTKTSAANRASATYSKDRRILLLDRLFQEAEAMIDSLADPADLDKLVNALSKLINARRLEDGEATSRSETSTVAKDTLEAKLDDLAKRRAQKAAKAEEKEKEEKAAE